MGKRLQLIAQEGERVKSFLMVEVWPRQGWTALAPSSSYPFFWSRSYSFFFPFPQLCDWDIGQELGGRGCDVAFRSAVPV